MRAVEKAIIQAKKILIQDHPDHCLEHTVGALPIDELRAIAKYR